MSSGPALSGTVRPATPVGDPPSPGAAPGGPADPEPGAPTRRRGAVALPSLVAGAGLAFSLPPWGWWIVAFPAAGLLFWRLGGLGARTRLWAGWLCGLGCFGPGLSFVRSFSGPGAVVLVAIEAGFVALGCLAVPARPLAARALAFPAALTLAEAVRMNWPFGGLPIGGVFLGQADGPLLGIARLGGPLALTAAVFVGGVCVAVLVGSVSDRRWPAGAAASTTTVDRRRTAVPVGVIALVLVCAAGLVAQGAPDGGPSTGAVTTAAVQGGGARGFRKSQVHPAEVLAAQMAATRELVARDRGRSPALVLWPEDVVSLAGPLDGSNEEGVLAALARSLHTTLVVGVTETMSATSFRNEVVAWGPDGSIVSRFEKVHRVPFGEYVPDRGFFAHLGDLSAVPRDAIPGSGSGLMATPVAPLGAMVSYEVFYAARGRASVADGAQLLIVPTNTASYAASQIPTQEVAAAQVQAVAQGRDLLQAAPTGFSAAITNRGTVLVRSDLGRRQVVFATLQRRTGRTLYVRAGDLPVLLIGAAGLGGAWLLARRRPRSDRAG